MDPYYEQMTPQYKIKKQIISIWPLLYNGINAVYDAIASSLVFMLKSAYRAIRGG